jgi:hypothetical protein
MTLSFWPPPSQMAHFACAAVNCPLCMAECRDGQYRCRVNPPSHVSTRRRSFVLVSSQAYWKRFLLQYQASWTRKVTGAFRDGITDNESSDDQLCRRPIRTPRLEYELTAIWALCGRY